MSHKRKLTEGTRQVFLLVSVVFLFRILYVDVYRHYQDQFGLAIYDYMFAFLRDFTSVGIAVILNIAFVIGLDRTVPYGKKPFSRILIMIGYICLSSAAVAILFDRNFLVSSADDRPFFSEHLVLSFLAVLLFNAFVVAVSDLILYFGKSRMELAVEVNKKRKAQHQYQQLKRQLNPHFLFNSLNLLDYLVQEGENRRASEFIRKLAGVYRYMLREGKGQLMPLASEMEFVGKYTDLLKERFAEGLEISVEIPEAENDAMVVPCSIQLLVENAIKHNVVSIEKPLRITVRLDGERIIVENNIQPKQKQDISTGVGLSNIRKQYADLADDGPVIEQADGFFAVSLPLLRSGDH